VLGGIAIAGYSLLFAFCSGVSGFFDSSYIVGITRRREMVVPLSCSISIFDAFGMRKCVLCCYVVIKMTLLMLQYGLVSLSGVLQLDAPDVDIRGRKVG
jgi:hypothetical protein